MIWNRAQQSLQNKESVGTRSREAVGYTTRENDITEKEDRKKPKINIAFQRLALEPGESRVGGEEENGP